VSAPLAGAPILVVAPQAPATPRMPGSPRLFQFCRHLSRRHPLALIAGDPAPERRALFEADPEARSLFREVHYVRPPGEVSWLRRQAHRLHLASNLRTDLRHPEHHRAVRALVAERLERLGDGALLYADCLETTQYLPPTPPCPAVVDLHDCLSYLAAQRARRERRPRARLALGLERLSLARWERSLARRFQAVILNSEVDAGVYRRLAPDAHVAVISNGVDTDYYARSRPPEGRPVLVFTGVMDYGPNQDAAIHFCQDILPRLRRAGREVGFWIVGASPPAPVRALQRIPGVEVFASVPDVRPYLEAASLFVCPLRYGAGMKNKVLTALAMHLPVVATPTSLANIDVQPGRDVLVADEPAAFARAIIRLLDEPVLAARLAARGRALVVERYAWAQRGEQLERLLEGLAAPGAAASAVA
jgi:glycosyltransferase involved in cell wall biosynthesis